MKLTNLFVASALMMGGVTSVSAQSDSKPWGFAIVSDEAGTAYNLDGGMRADKPSTIVLYASGDATGSQDMNNIGNAINQYDIVVLDGSKGDFITGQNIKLNSLKNKTVVGRSNARVCTQFYLTADDIAYLKAQNLDGLSSTDQYTGTLPDGTTLTCDKRAFFTKKAMEELSYKKTGAYTLPNKAGIFSVTSCENMIFRNITLIGPGAVDIDGSDLFTNQDSKHIWVDHCTFQDGQDGCLDSKRADYSTYSWCKFFYTDRTFSHPYTNGCGWVDETNPMILHLTFGYCEWGQKCGRRLPQCGSCYVHLVNNYHNCPGNSAGMTINDNCTALIEGNFAASGVNLPQTGSGANRIIYSHDNSFTGESNSKSVTVPYSYNIISYKNVPSTLEATIHGAGATMDDAFMPGEQKTLADGFGFYSTSANVTVGFSTALPVKNLVGAEVTFSSSDDNIVTVDVTGKIKGIAAGKATITATVNDPVLGNTTATITVNAVENSSFGSVKKWDFTKRSDESTAALSSNGWSQDGTNYTYDSDIDNDELPGLSEAAGLKFTCTLASQIVSYANSLRINKPFTVTIPDCKKGDKIILNFKSANKTATRGFETSTNTSTSGALTTDGTVANFEVIVADNGETSFISSTGGIYMFSFDLQREGASGIQEIENSMSKTTNSKMFNIAGQGINENYKGIAIKEGKKFMLK